MTTFNKLQIGQRLGAAFALLLAFSLAIGAFAIWQLGQVNETANDIDANWMPSVRLSSAINTAAGDFRTAELLHILSTDAVDKARFNEDMAKAAATVARSWRAYAPLISSQQERQMVEDEQRLWAAFLAEHQSIAKLSLQNKKDDALALLRGSSQSLYDELSAKLDSLVELNAQGSEAASKAGDALYNRARFWMLIALLLTLVLGAAMSMSITRSITEPLAQAVTVAQAVAAGNLGSIIDVKRQDESGQLLLALKQMNASLVNIVANVRRSSDSIAAGSAQIASGNADLSQRTESQASSLQQTAASMEQLTATVKHNAETARQATNLAGRAGEAAAQGQVVVGQVVNTMQVISTSSSKISNIIGTIDGIAFQTNILALNAAVEAARAGEQGRGFAVVAAEVRSLAQRCASAAKEIKVLIDQSVRQVGAGSKLAADAGSSMNTIVSQVRGVSSLITEISTASVEQSQGIGQVGDAVSQLDQVTQQNAALVEESAAAASSLNQQAEQLTQLVALFNFGAGSQPPSTA